MNYLIFTYHTSNNSNGDQVLKFGHILLGLLIEGIDEVTDPSQERNQQKNLHNIVPCQSSIVNGHHLQLLPIPKTGDHSAPHAYLQYYCEQPEPKQPSTCLHVPI